MYQRGRLRLRGPHITYRGRESLLCTPSSPKKQRYTANPRRQPEHWFGCAVSKVLWDVGSLFSSPPSPLSGLHQPTPRCHPGHRVEIWRGHATNANVQIWELMDRFRSQEQGCDGVARPLTSRRCLYNTTRFPHFLFVQICLLGFLQSISYRRPEHEQYVRGATIPHTCGHIFRLSFVRPL